MVEFGKNLEHAVDAFLPLSLTRAQVQGPLHTSVLLPRKFFGFVEGVIPRQEGFNPGAL